MAPALLSHDDLRSVVRLAPLVAIDLVIRNARNEVLLGLRNNAPAKGFYFVPGGMILKNERLRDAFARLLKNETNYTASLDDARLLGAFEHFYAENRFGDAGYGTHYVVLGYALKSRGDRGAETRQPAPRIALVERSRPVGLGPGPPKRQGLFHASMTIFGAERPAACKPSRTRAAMSR